MKHFILFTIFFLNFSIGSAQPNRLGSDKSSISIYPNPVATSFTIKFENVAKVNSIAIYSIIGNEVLNKKTDGNSKMNFNIQNFRKGKYIVRIFNNDGTTETQAIIKN